MDPNSEILAKSFVPEGTTAPRARTPEQQRINTAAKDLRERFEKARDSDHPTSALKRPEGTDSLSSIDTTKQIDRRVREKKDPTDTTEPDRRSEGEKLAGELRIIAEKGLDGIVDAAGNPDTVRQGAFIDMYVAQVLDQRPEFAKLSDNQKKALARDTIQSHEFRAVTAKGLVDTLSPDKQVETEDDDALKKLTGERKDLAKNKKESKQQLQKTHKELGKLKTIQTEHQPGGTRSAEIQTLASGLSTFVDVENSYRHFQALGQETTARVRTQVMSKRQAGVTSFTDTEEDTMNKLIQYEIDAGKLNALVAERDGIAAKIKEKRKEIKTLEKERTKIKRNLSEKDDDIEEIEDNLDEREDALLLKLNNLIPEAGNQLMDDDVDQRAAVQAAQLDKEASESKDKDQQTLLDARKTRWTRIEVKNGHPRPVYNKAQQDSDNIRVLTSNGDITNELRVILTRKLAPVVFDTPEEAAIKVAEIARIDKRLKDDPDFVRNSSADFVRDLVASRLSAGKVPFEGEMRLLEANGWGNCLEQAIEADNTLKNKIDTATNNLGGEPRRIERLKREFGSNWLAILGLLAAGAIAPAFVSGKLLRKEMGG